MQPRVAIITGSSKGIGEASARRFLAEGATVVGISTSPPSEPLASHPRFHAIVGGKSIVEISALALHCIENSLRQRDILKPIFLRRKSRKGSCD